MPPLDDRAPPLPFDTLSAAYGANTITPSSLVDHLLARIDRDGSEGIWIHRIPRAAVLERARALERSDPTELALYGVPFAVKDNIDVEGTPTTAGCPGFAYVARRTAPVVDRLLRAGAILVGKTNLDQFATGLVGTRSPYGIPRNPFDRRYVTGGSSSGSAAAVARGLVTFALGTDTAGSGRVPAAFTNLVGLKPSRGLLSATGVVPACRSLDCVSIFALTCDDARRVAAVATGFDSSDPYADSRADAYDWVPPLGSESFRFAAPRDRDLVSDVDADTLRSFEQARAHLEALGGRAEPIDLAPFFEATRLLYEGPWLAERLQGVEAFLSTSADSFLPVTRRILEGGRLFRATEVFAAIHRLEKLKKEVRPLFNDVLALLLPTAPGVPRIDEVASDPLATNARLGLYTNFVNLLDLAAVAVPAGLGADGLPRGVTLVGPWGSDASLLAVASLLHRRTSQRLGATDWPWPPSTDASVPRPSVPSNDRLRLAVVGAHLTGQPLNHQLTDRGGRLVCTTRTAPRYRLFALPTNPRKPGLLRVPDGEPGFAIEAEIWDLPRAEFGAFFAGVPPPLCLGTVLLEDGDAVAGFLCEAHATANAADISGSGGWRNFLAKG
jgi:allophanate hydrolase